MVAKIYKPYIFGCVSISTVALKSIDTIYSSTKPTMNILTVHSNDNYEVLTVASLGRIVS